MLDRLWCWFKGGPREEPPPRKTRLTPEEAIALAQAAIGETSELSRLGLASFEERDGRGVWHVTPPIGRGAVRFVDVDDATGEILAKGSRGLR